MSKILIKSDIAKGAHYIFLIDDEAANTSDSSYYALFRNFSEMLSNFEHLLNKENITEVLYANRFSNPKDINDIKNIMRANTKFSNMSEIPFKEINIWNI